MIKEKKYRFILQLNVEEWGMYKKGEIETFWMDLLDEQCGIIRWPIEKQWTVLRCDDYTGKTDKNGDNIYENDKVKFNAKDAQGNWSDEIMEGVVSYDTEDACFFIQTKNDKFPYIKFSLTKDIEVIEE